MTKIIGETEDGTVLVATMSEVEIRETRMTRTSSTSYDIRMIVNGTMRTIYTLFVDVVWSSHPTSTAAINVFYHHRIIDNRFSLSWAGEIFTSRSGQRTVRQFENGIHNGNLTLGWNLNGNHPSANVSFWLR